MTTEHSPLNLKLLEEIPHQSEANHEIAIRIIGCGIEIITGHSGIEMFRFEKNSGLANSGVNKEIDHWKIAYFSLILNKCFGGYRIIIVGVVFCKIVECKAGLEIQCFFEEIIGKVKRVSGDDLRHVENIVFLVYLLVKDSVI